MKLHDLISEALLLDMITQKYVDARYHPTLPLAIYNYSKSAQYDAVWNTATLNCRGLIIDVATNEIVARPLAKFFTWGQAECPDIPLDARVHVADKADGSLGILYPTPDGWAVATRGSFMSEQAQHATQVLRTRAPHFAPPEGYTYLVEIVYPGNRIVVDYGTRDDLYLLGKVQNDTGTFTPVEADDRWYDWPGPMTRSFGRMTFGDVLAMPPRANAEGVVLLREDTGDMVKVKQDDYVALHRIVTNVSARTLWEFLAVNDVHIDGATVKQTASRLRMDSRRVEQIVAVGPDWQTEYMADRLPDEFHGWVKTTLRRMTQEAQTIEDRIHAEFLRIYAVHGAERKSFARAVADNPDRGLMFALYNRRDITADVWRLVYPAAEKPFDRGEDVS